MAKKTKTKSKEFDFSKVNLVVGFPCYGGLTYASTMLSFIKLSIMSMHYGFEWSIEMMSNESLVTRARNNLMARAMYNTKATHFMFIDADIEFDPLDVLRLIVDDKDIIAGLYPKKELPIAYNANLQDTITIDGPLFTVKHAATGFLMFKRGVYEALCKAHPETKLISDQQDPKYDPYLFAIFDCLIDNKQYLSEDWTFCKRATDLGYSIWVDSRIHLNHIGTHTYKGDVKELQKIPEAVIQAHNNRLAAQAAQAK